MAQPYLVGYWQNWNDASAPYIPLDLIDSRYNVVNLSFAIPSSGTDYSMEFLLCCGETQVGLLTKIQSLQANGVKVNISIGGATAPILLDNLTEKNTFITTMNALINTYGFDGLDIDLEGSSLSVASSSTIANPTDAGVVNMIDAIQQIMAAYQTNFGKKMFLSAAPETAFVQGALSAWGGLWGAYLPVLDALRDDMDLLHVQLYNSGSMYGIDGNVYAQSTPDFIVSQVEAVIQGFTTVGMGGAFAGFPASKVAVGLPACPSAAGGGFTTVANVKAAIDYLMGNGSQPGTYVLQSGPYPSLGGMMTWSINWDAVGTCNATSGEYATNYVDIFESGTCWLPKLGNDISVCGLSFPYQLTTGTTANPNVTFTWTNLTTGQVLISNSTSANTLMINSAGTYQVKRDSTGCSKIDVIVVSNDLPSPNIGNSENLCSVVPSSISLNNSGAYQGGTTYQWYKNNVAMSGETSTTLSDIRIADTYKIIASYLNCTKESEIIVTSDLPEPVDGCEQSGSTVPLSIIASSGGPFEWYDAASDGNLLATGTSYNTPTLTNTTTYYVKDNGSLGSATTGPITTPSNLGALGNWKQSTEITFDALGTFTLKEITIYPLIYCFTHTVSFEIRNSVGTVMSNGSQSFSITDDGDCATLAAPVTVILSGGGVEIPTGTGYKIVSTGSIGLNHWQGPVTYPMNYSPYFEITGGDFANYYMAVHDWKVEGGSCARLPVIAEINPSCNLVLPVELLDFNVEKRAQAAYLNWTTASEINHLLFELQKSEDGIDFEAIDFFPAKSVNGAFYEFTDREIHLGKTYFYRLKQIDIDGQESFSAIQFLSFKSNDFELNIYPNPAKEVIHFSFPNMENTSNLRITIFDSLGKLVLSEPLENSTLSVNHLEKGVYWVRILDGERVLGARVLLD